MEKYINQSLKQSCEEIEEIQSREDEMFMEELDQALGFNESKRLIACCGCRGGWCPGCVPDETLLDECGWEG